MLKFTDLHLVKHIIDIDKICHVQLRDCSSDGKWIFTFHLIGPHLVAATTDRVTADRIMKEIGEHHAN